MDLPHVVWLWIESTLLGLVLLLCSIQFCMDTITASLLFVCSAYKLVFLYLTVSGREKHAVKSLVVGRPILLALEDIDGGPSLLEKALRFVEQHGKSFFLVGKPLDLSFLWTGSILINYLSSKYCIHSTGVDYFANHYSTSTLGGICLLVILFLRMFLSQ